MDRGLHYKFYTGCPFRIKPCPFIYSYWWLGWDQGRKNQEHTMDTQEKYYAVPSLPASLPFLYDVLGIIC